LEGLYSGLAAALLAALLGGLPGGVGAADLTSVPAPIARPLRSHDIDLADVSLYVHRTGDPAPLVAVNPEVPRNPASTIKLLTTRAGLAILGPAYTWKTEAWASGDLRDGRLEGDLIIKGRGDPDLTPEDLWRLLRGVRERGILRVGGDIVLDQTHFTPAAEGRGDFDGAADSPYNALPAALSVNAQTTEIHLVRDVGDGVRVFTDPPLDNLRVDNALKVVQAPCQGKHHRPNLRVAEEAGLATLTLTGTFAADCRESSYRRLLMDPAVHAAGAIANLWRGLGGGLEGVIRAGERPPGARLIHSVASKPLGELVRTINKESDNLMSRTLFLTLGAVRLGAPASLPKSRRAVGDWLAGAGLDFPELVIDNGAGLSRDARIAAGSMGRLLVRAYDEPSMPEFLASLSIAGVDGTMRKRLRGTPVAGRAHVKTGTLRGVTALAGYVLDQDGHWWVVVSMMNNPRLQLWRGKAVEDALLRWVHSGAGAEAAPPTGPRSETVTQTGPPR
jgi:D-alanyl-D-alanine carboxypeptidase/D-alanyl-D-alanine-endopeptidase (penicillin-binding protein 4)